MNRYEIRCTADQTKKALELGAPIEIHDTFDSYDIKESNIFYKDKFIELPDGRLIEHITAEQMVGWLEEQGLYIDVTCDNIAYEFGVWKDVEPFPIPRRLRGITARTNCVSRKEATIAAIDAALEYLLTHKNQQQC